MIDAAGFERIGLLMVRPGMLVIATPGLGGLHVPIYVRIGLSVLLAILLAPHAPAAAGGAAGLSTALVSEALIGLALAMAARAIIAAAEFGGYLAGFQLGLSYAAIVDPASGVRNNVLAVLYGHLAIVTFLAIDGHHAMIRALAASYAAVPVGAQLTAPAPQTVAGLLGIVIVTGFRMAAPVVTTLLLVELALGLLCRAAPTLNMMVVGTPLRLMAGLAALAFGIQAVPPVVGDVAGAALAAATRLIGTAG